MKRHAKNAAEDKVLKQFMADYFDMTCDLCEDMSFATFNAARRHYKEVHNEQKGYVRCCKKKLCSVREIREHVKRHLSPDFFT